MNKHLNARNITKMALCAALLCVSAYIIIPIGVIPLTLQTMLVTLAALLLPPAEAFFTMLIYMLLGLCGLPVFSGGAGGPAKLFGPTGGYIFAFLLAAPAMSFMKIRIAAITDKLLRNSVPKTSRIIAYSMTGIFIGMVIIYLIGSVYMMITLDKTLMQTLAAAVIPFIPLDIVKCVAASLISVPVERALARS